MADSENSRTLPAITCRNPLQTTEWFLAKNVVDHERRIPGMRNVVLIRWNAWSLAFRDLDKRSLEQQDLETKLFTMVPGARVEIQLPDYGGVAVVPSIYEIQGKPSGGNFLDVRANAAGERLIKRQRRDSADVLVAYNRAERPGSEGSIAEGRLAAELSEAPAMLTAAASAKLRCILKRGAPRSHSNEFLWPQLSAMLVNLLGMNGVFSLPGRDR
ncbi:hypothetical protein JNB91_15975 [Rhizobium wenxiniae]|uniref:hypothetical protein n=1 Tax=Rhizobium wenxiniae TaxID=1737357 RepID=UPI001C6E3F11|nr:hypothetical protein [Rhizobium wenxiniae]MBW9089334.1 hypothetical protein [Rhizobium wenxiniae]